MLSKTFTFMSCTESLASENASCRAAMQLGEKNIDDLPEGFKGRFRCLLQSGIDKKLFDVISGF
jgi:F-type H+-transporting ATPase subunit gamma